MLFLEEFKAHGFKSYAEEVTASFNPGIGVIIGNNGVGKSNILDAITWALGEDDLGKLRCYSTEDLFYTGGRTIHVRKKSGWNCVSKRDPIRTMKVS